MAKVIESKIVYIALDFGPNTINLTLYQDAYILTNASRTPL